MAKKYIDAEKLIAEIEGLQKSNSIIANNAANSNMQNFYYGEADCCKQLLSFIDSLQQEQPTGEEYTIEVGKHTHTLRVGSQSDIDNLIRQEKQEQPDVNFKVKERKWVHDAVDNYFPEDGDFMSEFDFRKIIKDTARHFYELGRKGGSK